jgi:hypothetical protein
VLLAKEAHAIQHLSRAGSRCFQPRPEFCIFALEAFDMLRVYPLRPWSSLQCFYARLCLQGAPSEGSKLVTEVANELLQVAKCDERVSLIVA